MGQIIAIVGRPNVGKSTLFNRLTETRDAIVDEISGVTRDRNYGKVFWNGRNFSVIDTGGYILGSEDSFEKEIRKQVNLAIDEASAIIFMVDVMEGLTGLDEDVSRMLRKTDKPVYVVANKADNNVLLNLSGVFYSMGLGEVYCISSINGSGTGELLDAITSNMPIEAEEEDSEVPKFSIVGRPNVGKSSLLNALIGEERNIVTPIAGTTRDSIYTRYNKFGHDFFLVDTAGIRKKAKVKEDLEFYSVMRSIRAIEYCDVCMILIDATIGVESQDLSIFSLAVKNLKGVVILVNKWDLVEKNNQSVKQFEEHIRKQLEPFNDVPIVFVSATTKQRVFKALEEALRVHKNRLQHITTSQLNSVLLPIIEATPPPAYKGKYIKIKYITQLPTHAPAFAFFSNLPQYVRDPYKRFLENRLREIYDFCGVPVRIFIRKK